MLVYFCATKLIAGPIGPRGGSEFFIAVVAREFSSPNSFPCEVRVPGRRISVKR